MFSEIHREKNQLAMKGIHDFFVFGQRDRSKQRKFSPCEWFKNSTLITKMRNACAWNRQIRSSSSLIKHYNLVPTVVHKWALLLDESILQETKPSEHDAWFWVTEFFKKNCAAVQHTNDENLSNFWSWIFKETKWIINLWQKFLAEEGFLMACEILLQEWDMNNLKFC